jgi:hypothetical protein
MKGCYNFIRNYQMTYGKTFEFDNAALAKKGFFFIKREKKGRCFLPSAQKNVRMTISHYTKNYITS